MCKREGRARLNLVPPRRKAVRICSEWHDKDGGFAAKMLHDRQTKHLWPTKVPLPLPLPLPLLRREQRGTYSQRKARGFSLYASQ